MAIRFSVLAWRIPGMGEPGGLPSLGSHRVGHNWSALAAAAAAEYIMRNAGLDETQAGIKIAGRNINNLRYAGNTHRYNRKGRTAKEPFDENERGEWKSWLKLNIQKTKIMASSPITSWQIDGKTVETVAYFIFRGSKITADGDCSHEINRRLLLGRKVMTNLLSLSCFSSVRLCVTPETAAHQAPPSLGFSRQEYWGGLPFPSPMHESEKWKRSRPVTSDS